MQHPARKPSERELFPVLPPVIPSVFMIGIRLNREAVPSFEEYPFCIPAIRNLTRLDFHPQVTFLVGENGSGKSTLMEAIALKLGFNPEGGGRDLSFSTHGTHSNLHESITLERGPGRMTDGYFLRAESFYNVASEIERAEEEFPSRGPSYRAYGGKSLHAQSHGEAFLSLLCNRLQGGGVYLFDEPESALSPQRQLSVLPLIHRLVRHRSQLLIATHSPILLAYPHARIFHLSEHGIAPIAYTETEHYLITRDFLNRHERMIELLIEEEEKDLKSKER